MKTVNCGNCGAGVKCDLNTVVFLCSYCDSILVFDSLINNLNKGSNGDNSYEIKHRVMLPKLKYKANLNASTFNSQGGHLLISDEEIFFKPHKMNFGDLSSTYIKISEIVEMEIKGILIFATLIISDINGKSLELVTWSNKQIILEIQRRMSI